MVSDVTIQTAIDQQSATSLSNANLAEDFTEFLTLLTTQLQNQDPLSPMDSTEFTNQLVLFTQAEQMINTNEKLDSLVALGVSDGLSSAQNYVGQDISYISSEFYFDGTTQDLRYSLPSNAASATMRIYNENGALVYEEDVSTSAGAHSVTWNGQLNGGGIADDGTYEIEIDALDANDESIEATTVVTGPVSGVESQNGAIYLIVGERAVALGNVLSTQESNAGADATTSLTSALSYMGLEVGYAANEILLSNSGQATIDYTLADDADSAKIIIYDDQGNQVFIDSVDTSAGSHSYEWDASGFTAGEYTFEIDAIARSSDEIKESNVNYDYGEDIEIDYTLQQTADDVVVEIRDSTGSLIRTDDANRNSGSQTYIWDGTDDNGDIVEDGEYTITITSYWDEDEQISSSSSTYGTVTGVEMDNGVVFLEVDNSLTTIPLSEILTVNIPDDGGDT